MTPEQKQRAQLAIAAWDAELLRKLKHSIGQAKISGNDWRRELELMSSMIDSAMSEKGKACITMLEVAPHPPKLSDERILELIRKTDSGRRPWGIGSTEEDAVEFARTIERELLGE